MAAIIFQLLPPILCAVLAGGILGLDREMRARPAGFRTHILVCLASASLMLAPAHQHMWADPALEPMFRTDPTRMGQGIMTGIGFLGAGVIFRHGLTIHGLTTAASLWITAGIGILFGLHFYAAGWLATGAAAITLVALHWVDHHLPGDNPVDVVARYRRDAVPSLEEQRAQAAAAGVTLSLRAYRLLDGGEVVEHRLLANSRKGMDLRAMARHLEAHQGLVGLELRPR